MKVVDEGVDRLTGKPYYLCRENLAELEAYVKKRLGNDYREFNSDQTELIDTKNVVLDEAAIKAEYEDYRKWEEKDGGEEFKGKSRKKIKSYETFLAEKHKEAAENQGDKKKRFAAEESKWQFILNNALENGHISLWSEKVMVRGSHVDLQGNFYLIDGFLRLLFDFHYTKKQRERDIYVRVYDKRTTDQDVMSMMFHLNLWKMAHSDGPGVWFDRGWRYYIYKRTGIKLDKHLGYLEHYVVSNEYWDTLTEYHKVLTNQKFYDDLKELDKLVAAEDGLIGRGKGDNVIDAIMSLLGRYRLKGNMKDFKAGDLKHFLALNVNEVNKIRKMDVHGYYWPRIQGLIKDFTDTWEDDAKMEKMRAQDPDKVVVKDIPPEYFMESLPKEVKDKYRVEHKGGRFIYVKGKAYSFEANKLYSRTNFVNYKYRVYAFFGGTYCLYKDGHRTRHWDGEESYGIIDAHYDVPSTDCNRLQYGDAGMALFSGTFEDAKKKMGELAKTDYSNFKLDRARTLFLE